MMTVKEALAEIQRNGPASPSRIITLVSKTDAKLTKTGRVTGAACPYAVGIEKWASRHGMIGTNYTSIVNNRRLAEGQPVNYKDEVVPFNAQALWNGAGQHVSGSPYLVKHRETGEEYLAFMPLTLIKEGGEIIPNEKDRWRDKANGRFISVDDLSEFLPIPSKNENQEIDKKVLWRVFKLSSVVSIKADKLYSFV